MVLPEGDLAIVSIFNILDKLKVGHLDVHNLEQLFHSHGLPERLATDIKHRCNYGSHGKLRLNYQAFANEMKIALQGDAVTYFFTPRNPLLTIPTSLLRPQL